MKTTKLLIIVLFLLESVLTFAATRIGKLYYNLDSDSLTATVTYHTNYGSQKHGDNNMYDPISNTGYCSYRGTIKIPETVEYQGVTYRVTQIGEKAFTDCALDSVIIPESIWQIGKNAFKGCIGLNYITIPESVTKIQSDAFSSCI